MNDRGNGNDNDPTPADALRALVDRGVNGAHDLIELATPTQILAACNRWDKQRGVGAGLLVKWIRDGEFDDPEPEPHRNKGEQLHARFDAYARRYPIGTVPESHYALARRRWPEDELDCPGRLVVTDTTYPVIAVECDCCGFEAAYPLRALHVLGSPLQIVPDPPPDELQPF